MIHRPLPFEIPYSIQCNASGSGTYTQQFGNDYWYLATISGNTQGGNPSWTIMRNSSFLRPGLGQSVLLSAGLCSLGTKLDIQVANAAPNAVVTGLIHGLKATNPADLLAAGSMDTASTFTAQNTANPRVKIYPDGTSQIAKGPNLPSFVATHGTATTKTFTLDPSTTNIRVFLFSPVALTNPGARMALVGHNTSIPLQPTSILLTSYQLGKPTDFRVSPEIDNQVDLTIDLTNTSPTNDVNVFVSELFGSETTVLSGIEDIKIPTMLKYYDWYTSQDTASGTPKIPAGPLNQSVLIVALIQVSIVCVSSAVFTPKLQLVTANGSGSEIWSMWMACVSSPNPAVDRFSESGMAIVDSIFNDTLALQMDRALVANSQVTMNFGGWLL